MSKDDKMKKITIKELKRIVRNVIEECLPDEEMVVDEVDYDRQHEWDFDTVNKIRVHLQ